MPWESAGPLRDIPTRWTTIHIEFRGPGPCCSASRGSRISLAEMREYYWVPRLRRLTKKVVKSCQGCRRFRAKAYTSPPPGNLPRDHTVGQTPFQVIGLDLTGPLRYRKKPKTEGKACILQYPCSLAHAVYVDLVPNLETTEFIRSLKCFIARRGRPQCIYSDNGKTFVGASKWIQQVMKDERTLGSSPSKGSSGNSISVVPPGGAASLKD